MGNVVERLPSGSEMMTIAHLQGLLDEDKEEDDPPDGNRSLMLNARIERMCTRLNASNKIARPLTMFSVFERTLFVSFLERYASYARHLFATIPPQWGGLNIVGVQTGSLIVNSLNLHPHRNMEEAGKERRRLSETKLEKKSYWSLTKDYDEIIEFYTYIFVLFETIARSTKEKDRLLLDNVTRTVSKVLRKLLADGTTDGVHSLRRRLGITKFPRASFTDVQYKHWISRFNRAFAGSGQRGQRLTEREIRKLFGESVDVVNWCPPSSDDMAEAASGRERTHHPRTARTRSGSSGLLESRRLSLARVGRLAFRRSLGSGLYRPSVGSGLYAL